MQSNQSRPISQLLAVVVTVLAITTLYLAKTVILPLALALLFTFVLAPVVTRLERARLPRVVAIPTVMLAAAVVLGTVSWIVFTQLIAVTDALPAYTNNVQEKIHTLEQRDGTSLSRAEREIDDLSAQLRGLGSNMTGGLAHDQTIELGTPGRPVSVQEVGGNQGRLDAISGALGLAVSIALILVFTFFMLLKREDLRNRVIQLTGQGHLYLMTQAMDETSRRISRYLSLQSLVNICFGLIVFLFLHLIGLPHALLFGAMSGLLRFIPYLGAPVGALMPTALSIAVFNGWTRTLLIMAVFFCLEVITGNFVEPQVYGKHTGLSSLAVLVAAIFWALIWGPIGLVLSVPLTVCLVVLGSHVPSLEFLNVLLGDQPVMEPGAHYYQRLLANDQREASQVLHTQLRSTSLESLYDHVLIPALSLSEMDRHRNALDESTVAFISGTTKDLVEEFSLETLYVGETQRRIACLPVRDDADEVVGIMLAQLLGRAGYAAQAIPIGSVEGMLAEVTKSEAEVICLSALPPYAVSHARGLYKKLRARHPQVPIVIGLWNYSDDPVKAAQEISGGEQKLVCTTLAQTVVQVGLAPPDTLETLVSPAMP